MNINSLSKRQYNNIIGDEQYLYDHLLECVKTKSPQQVLDRFRYLFIQARSYDNQQVLEVLAKLIGNKEAHLTFPSVLNRCCHILINMWQLNPKTQPFIIELAELFDLLPYGGGIGKSYASRMTQLVKQFVTTDYYKQIQRLAVIIAESQGRKSNLSPSNYKAKE